MPRKQETVVMEETIESDVVLTEEKVEEKMGKAAEGRQAITDIPGVGAATAEKLFASGHDSLLSIAVTSPKELVELAGVTEVTARKMIQYAREKLDLGFESGSDVLKKRESVEKIHCGSQALDALLGGGFETRAITEAYGMYGSGKCVSKDTKVLYFNSSKSHLQAIEEVYNKYAALNGEKPFDTGHIVEVPQVEVMGLTERGISRTKASTLFKEKVPKLISIRTKRGRSIKITPSHKLLSFSDGLKWKPAATLKAGAVLAYPRELNALSECNLTKDDAYFLGLFAAEGTSNPFSISTSSERLKNWMVSYIESKFDYRPTVRPDSRRDNVVYAILLRKTTKEFMGELADTDSSTKLVPESIFGGDRNIAAAFLGGYMDGDGFYDKDIAEATTKSKELANGLAYLFSKLGISVTAREKLVNNEKFHRLSIVGDDRSKLSKVISKIKQFEYNPRNSGYGYPSQFSDYLKSLYRETLGGNRGRTAKPIGNSGTESNFYYEYLVGSNSSEHVMNEKTMASISMNLYRGLQTLIKAKDLITNLDELDHSEFVNTINSLPFAFNKIAKEIGISKSGVRNYMGRGVAPGKINAVKQALTDEIEKRIVKLEIGLSTMKNFMKLNWDTIEDVKEIDYHDYVYDFVVPEGHSFVGGEMPTIMHNTQIGHVLAANCLKQYPDAVVVYIDTESTFRPERIVQMAKRLELDADDALKRIKIARAFNSDHQIMLAEKVEDLIKDGLNVKLVIVDSLTAHFRAEFIGRGTLADRQQKINKHLHTLMKLAEMHNLAVYMTNQVMSKPDTFFGDPTEAIGGHIVAHASTYRLYLRRGKKGSRVAKLVDSPNLPEAEAAFMVDESGLLDV